MPVFAIIAVFIADYGGRTPNIVQKKDRAMNENGPVGDPVMPMCAGLTALRRDK
jgi:hypothetical protein